MNLTIVADSFIWNSLETTNLELWVCSDREWIDENGDLHGASNQESGTFTFRVEGITYNSTTQLLTTPEFEIPPTRNAVRGNSVRLFFWIMKARGKRARMIASIPGAESGLTIPVTVISSDETISDPLRLTGRWSDFIAYNSTATPPPFERFPSFADMARLIEAALGSAQGPAGTSSELQYKNNGVFGAVPGSSVSGGNVRLGGNLTLIEGDFTTGGIIAQSINGANALVPTDQVTPVTVGIGTAGNYSDGVGGNIFQISSQIRNDGATPAVAVFGQAYADGPLSHALGANFTGEGAFAGAIATALEADHRCTAAGAFSTGITIFSSGTHPTSQHMFIASNTEASRPAFGIIVGVISGVQPLTDSGTIMMASGAVATGVGIDFSAATFLNGLMRGPNDAPIFMKNSGGVAIPVLNLDGSNFTTLKSGGAGFVIGNAASTANLMIISDAPPSDGNTCMQLQVTKDGITSTMQVGLGAAAAGVRPLVVAA